MVPCPNQSKKYIIYLETLVKSGKHCIYNKSEKWAHGIFSTWSNLHNCRKYTETQTSWSISLKMLYVFQLIAQHCFAFQNIISLAKLTWHKIFTVLLVGRCLIILIFACPVRSRNVGRAR
jgi:hypothetical protein